MLELRQAFVHVADMVYCADDLLAIVVAATESQFPSKVAVRTVMFTCPLPLFPDPSGEAADPRFEFHVLIASHQFGGNERGDAMLALVSVLFMTLLPKPPADFTISLPEFVKDGTAVPVLPQDLL